MKLVDLTGQRFGRLTVLRRYEKNSSQGKTLWLCKCDCGTETTVTTSNLKSGHTQSCGCSRVDAMRKVATKHGMTHTSLYNVWLLMRRRCSNQNDKHYNDYGGRGISVCSEWNTSFQAFYDWAMANGYADELTLDRIDNNSNYNPTNCRWVTMQRQCNNRRSNRYCEYNGRKYTLAELSEMSGVGYDKLKQRINKLKWPVDRAVETP